MQDSMPNDQIEGRSPLDSSIEELGIPTRAQNVLLKADISTVGDVLAALEKGDEALTGIKGFGPKSLASLKERLEELDLFPAGEAVSSPPDLDISEPTIAEEPSPAEIAAEAPEDLAAPPSEPEPEPEPELAAEPLAETPPLGERLSATLAQPRERIGIGSLIAGAVGVLILIALFLPPISLLNRLGLTGYTALNAKNEYFVEHEDGLTVSVDPETDDGLRVRLDSVPRLELLEGSAGAELREAIEILPEHLTIKSPLYQIQVRGEPSQPVMLDAVIPNDAEPWETLDLYTWSGESWEWVGSELHTEVAEHEFLRAYTTDVPENLLVVQTDTVTPSICTAPEPGDNATPTILNTLAEINPTGLILSADGGFVVEPNDFLQPIEGTDYAVIPTLYNGSPQSSPNLTALLNVLNEPETQQNHIANIVQLCTKTGFAGIDVNYQGIGPDEREAYSNFIAALADALHAEGLRLGVVVERPIPTGDGWDTGGYDWAKLGDFADAVKVPFPSDLAAYTEGGEAHRLLNWATAQINRYKLHMMVSSLSAEKSNAGISHIPLNQALSPFGKTTVHDNVTQVDPNEQITFGLSGQLLSITRLEDAGTYRLEYQAGEGDIRTIWLGTADALAAKLEWAKRFHLGGVAVTDLLSPGNAPGIVDTIVAYGRTTAAPVASQEIKVSWTIVNSAQTTVDQQSSPLTDPDYTWTVMVPAGDYTANAKIAGFDHGSVPIVVNSPEPEVTEVVTTTEEELSTRDTTPPSNVNVDCLGASFMADVTIPDNTQMEKGEEFVKTWKLSNSGTCDWPEDTVLARVESQLGGPESVAVGTVPVGEAIEISIDLVAPEEDGTYDGIWTLKTDDTEIPNGKVTAVIKIGEGGETDTNTPVVAPVSSGSFELGGHVRDMGFPYADKMRYAGMTWAKVQIHYGQDAAGLVNAAHGRGFKIQLSALGTPGMVTQPGFEQNFANWVAKLAAAGADAIEVWNEPNIDREWQIGYISPQAYTKLLCASYNAIKAANPNAAVISAAPAPTGSFGGACQPNGGNCDDEPWLRGLRDAGAAQCMDYIGAHHNSGATSPSARSGHPADQSGHHSWYFLPQTELYYNIFGGARKLFYTEMGYASQEGVPPFHDAFGWARGTNNSEQAAWLSEAVRLSINTGMVRCIIVWNIDFVRYGYDPQDGYAIIRPGGSCPACDALHNILGSP